MSSVLSNVEAALKRANKEIGATTVKSEQARAASTAAAALAVDVARLEGAPRSSGTDAAQTLVSETVSQGKSFYEQVAQAFGDPATYTRADYQKLLTQEEENNHLFQAAKRQVGHIRC